ncbi:hypothetical protein OBBRIDRAFT_586116 [Obba rivulosa]|uniref:Uncharacterized protein n=1 Tax=Obba rivulosa TaxID=1052685 RepID=A0A8E2ATE1_9APHY|nr:hypothetical protein OBBRIDRAFT_586116 [Obba rivulosa]
MACLTLRRAGQTRFTYGSPQGGRDWSPSRGCWPGKDHPSLAIFVQAHLIFTSHFVGTPASYSRNHRRAATGWVGRIVTSRKIANRVVETDSRPLQGTMRVLPLDVLLRENIAAYSSRIEHWCV